MSFTPFKPANQAQALLLALGLGDLRLLAHRHTREIHPTKKGPGRLHGDVSRKEPKQRTSAGSDFKQHNASAEKRERRAAIKSVGRRQYLKVTKAAQAMRDILA